MNRAILTVLAAACLCACAHGRNRAERPPQGVTVEAEGWAAAAAGDPLGTARRSLADAQSKAVEKVAGLSLRSRTRIDKAVAVESRIIAEAGGYIRSYKVLDEREEGGFYKTRIRAVVLKGKPEPGMGPPLPLPGEPRLAVVVYTRAHPDRTAAEKGVSQALRDAGAAVGFGKADYVVSGEAEVSPSDSSGLEGFASCRARLAVELRDAASGELLAARSLEASAIDPSNRIAADKALSAAGRLAGAAMAADLRSALYSR